MPRPRRPCNLPTFRLPPRDPEGDHEILTRDEELSLFTRLRAGDRSAAERIARCNIRLVISIAMRYRRHGLDWDQLMSAGRYGLAVAIERYDPVRGAEEGGARFMTYADKWIRRNILLDIDDAPVIHVPAGVCYLVRRETRGLSIPLEKVEHVAAARSVRRMALAWTGTTTQPVDVVASDPGREGLGYDEPGGLAEEDWQTELDKMRGCLSFLLGSLEERTISVMHMRVNGLAFSEIGRKIGVTGERARQIFDEGIAWARRRAKGMAGEIEVGGRKLPVAGRKSMTV